MRQERNITVSSKKERNITKKRDGAYLTNATSPIHFCWKMFGVEWRAFDHPKASDDLILAQPCTYISPPILKIEQFLSRGTGKSDDSAPPPPPWFYALHALYMQQEGTSYVMLSTSRRQSWYWSYIPILPKNNLVRSMTICKSQIRCFEKQ
jgi:hypothetical protein